MSFKPIPLNKNTRSPILIIALIVIIVLAGVGYAGYRYFLGPSSERWREYRGFLQDPASLDVATIRAGDLCGDAPFAFPTTGVIFGLWDQSYRPGHRHAGLDIFPGTDSGVTPVYAAYSGYLTRKADWTSTVIIRLPDDPLKTGRQIWNYYTHMASKEGESYISDEFPPGTFEVYVPAGTLLGYVGNFSGDPDNPTGIHLHFSVVIDDGNGAFLNELDIENTYDPTPYFNLPVNHNDNPDHFPVCDDQVEPQGWGQSPGE